MKLLYDKTVVYATHQLEFLEAADLILVMKDGKIVESGRYRDLKTCPNSELVQQMSAHEETVNQIPCQKDNSVSCRPCQKNQIEIDEENIQEIIMDWKRNKEEEAMTGRIKWSVYSTFVTSAYKGALVPVILLCQILFQVMHMGSNYWISWASEQKGRVSNGRLMGTFALLSGGSSIFILGRTVLMAAIAVETAQRLFRKAPILHHFSESISGATTICCFNQEKMFLTKAMALIDGYSRVAFYNYVTMEYDQPAQLLIFEEIISE